MHGVCAVSCEGELLCTRLCARVGGKGALQGQESWLVGIPRDSIAQYWCGRQLCAAFVSMSGFPGLHSVLEKTKARY